MPPGMSRNKEYLSPEIPHRKSFSFFHVTIYLRDFDKVKSREPHLRLGKQIKDGLFFFVYVKGYAKHFLESLDTGQVRVSSRAA